MNPSSSRCALMFALVALLGLGCGYQFTPHARAARPGSAASVSLAIESLTSDPGLPLMVRRGLESAAGSRGLRWLDDAPPGRVPRLDVAVARVETRPVAITRVEASDLDAVAATGYEVRVWLDLTWRDAAGELQIESLSGAARYLDQTLPLATDEARRDALGRALGRACDEAAAWTLAQQSHGGGALDE